MNLIEHCKRHRDNPQWADNAEHVDRWERAMASIRGETGGMTASEARSYADRGWGPWRPVADWLEGAGRSAQASSQPERPVPVACPPVDCHKSNAPPLDDETEQFLAAELEKIKAWAATLDPEQVKCLDVTVAGAEPTGRFQGQRYIDTFWLDPDMPRTLEECQREWAYLAEVYVPTPVPVPSEVIEGPVETLVTEDRYVPTGQDDRGAYLLVYLDGWDSGTAGAEHDKYIIRDRLGVRGAFHFEFRRLGEDDWHPAPDGPKPSRYRGDPEQAWYYLTGCRLPRAACEVRWGFRRWHVTQSDSPPVRHDGPWEGLGEFRVGLNADHAHDWVVRRCQDAQPHQVKDVPEPHVPLQYLGERGGDLTDEKAAAWAAMRDRDERESDQRDIDFKRKVQEGIDAGRGR